MYRDDYEEKPPLYLFKPVSATGFPGGNSQYLEPYVGEHMGLTKFLDDA